MKAPTRYEDSQGRHCSLAVLCMREPARAKSRIESLLSELAAEKKERVVAAVKSIAAYSELESELATVQEEGRVMRAALEFALDEWAAETTDCDTCGKPKLENFYMDEARAEAKPTDGGGECF